ncbi:MAG: respiratory nitrate reductase subunit gamma [Deltaproteobacteria bacterium]|nr:respiratory nitrate reductase subunit gamma [Deltaproteobacteria bacterium]
MTMLKYTFLWMMILVSIGFFLVGVYKNIVSKIAHILWVNDPGPTGTASRDTRVRLPFASKETIFREAIIQKRIENRSAFLWFRHLLIAFGFVSLFVVAQLYALFIKVYPIAYFVSGVGRGYLKFSLELTGLVLFVGLTLGLIHRIMNAEQEKTFVDLRLLLLLWLVVATGFMTEILRFIIEPHDAFIAYSFVAAPVARAMAAFPWQWNTLYTVMWTTHAILIAFFFACIPFTKFVHIFVAPFGRSITMGQDTSRLKREKIAEGLL